MLLCLAPMDGITDCAFRIVVKNIFEKYNKDDELLLFTEFMSSDGYVHNPTGVIKHLLYTSNEKPLVAQIFGGNKDVLVQTAIDLDRKYDFYAIELNIGCPSPKVMACGGGSFLMRDKSKTLDIIKEIRQNIKTKFSIKTRIGLDRNDKLGQFDFLLKASEYVDMIGLHGRTMKDGHSGDVDFDYIYNLKKELNPKVKLVGNGGIDSYQQAKDKLGNLDGIMIGQGSFGDPWIFTQHRHDLDELFETINYHLDLSVASEIYFKQNHFEDGILQMPSIDDFKNIMQNYSKLDDGFKQYLKAPIEFRKHLFWYVRGLSQNAKFKQEVVSIKDYSGLKSKIKEYYDFKKTKLSS